ncbi:helix-turn-helix transcriptional regulator [Ornithinimicrobium avium]|uniref:helix-turn-helix transcriptional regulator n=1 Tax=Ornithinimicrobium avium TaxID=2283195 RepID=UPI0013B375AA|nr:helix-turn-helix transcriptional regulator [Ornithinimicrobium avium]
MIVGREREKAALAEALGATRAGRGAALLLRGEPGAGKSTLLTDAVAATPDLRVLRIRGVESESPLGFAALHRLLRPLLPGLKALPPGQAAALRGALGMGEGADPVGTDRFLVYLAVLTLLSDTSAAVPTVVVVDDLHWVDAASREALLFVARRTEGEHLAVLLAARDVLALDAADLPVLTVGPLPEVDARDLLAARSGAEVPREVAERLHASTAGNALALAELARELSLDVLTGRAPLPRTLPVTRAVETAFLDRYRRLEPAARTVLLVAAADDSGDLAVLGRAVHALGLDETAVEAAERSGLVRREGSQVELHHPLVRSAVYAGASTGERRSAHAALAAALPGPQDADRRAWHRAAATDQPDEEVVAELEAAARRSAATGGHEAASAAWERAAELTRDPAARGNRLHRAAASAWTVGQPDRAATLADAALSSLDDPLLRADAALLRARVEWNTGSAEAAHRRLVSEAFTVLPHDPDRAREMGMFAAALGAMVAVEPTADLLQLVGAPASPRDRCVAQVLSAFVHVSRHEWLEAVRAVRSAETEVDHAQTTLDGLLPNLALAAMHLAVDDVALRLHERLLARARNEGALIMVLYALTRRGGLDVVLGRWDELASGARESLDLAHATGRPSLAAMPQAWLALVSALRGGPDAADLLADLEQTIASGPLGSTEATVKDQVLWIRAELAGSPASALHHYEQMTHGFAERLIALDRIETAVLAGRRDLAQRWVDHLAAFAGATGSPWAGAVTEHGMALLAGSGESDHHFLSALALHAESLRRMDAARTHLAYGQWLRRARRRVDARPHLRAALQTFEDVGASRWADRAADELRASGERARRRTAADASMPRLTPTERRVATLVAQGLPTRDVATALFVSPRTVDFHLRNVFTKLGITSRAELAHATLD